MANDPDKTPEQQGADQAEATAAKKAAKKSTKKAAAKKTAKKSTKKTAAKKAAKKSTKKAAAKKTAKKSTKKTAAKKATKKTAASSADEPTSASADEPTSASADEPTSSAAASTVDERAVGAKEETRDEPAPERSGSKTRKATRKQRRPARATSTPPADRSVDVKDLAGSKVGTVDLPGAWFSGEVKVHVMHQVVTAQLAAARRGTHKTKTRAEVAGGGAKPWRQKGTGRSRQGSIRSPQWIGGGVAHGRTPKDWSQRVNKKLKRSALRSALTDRANDGRVTVVRDLTFEAPRTKDAVAALGALEAQGKVLVVLADWHLPTARSFRNLPHVRTLVVDQLNTHDVVLSDTVLFDEAALDLIGSGRRAGSESATQEVSQ